jgi:hypothetical protein
MRGFRNEVRISILISKKPLETLRAESKSLDLRAKLALPPHCIPLGPCVLPKSSSRHRLYIPSKRKRVFYYLIQALHPDKAIESLKQWRKLKLPAKIMTNGQASQGEITRIQISIVSLNELDPTTPLSISPKCIHGSPSFTNT